MVVDLAVDREDRRAVRTVQRLLAALDIHDREALVRQDRSLARVDAAPVRSTVALPSREAERPAAEGLGLRLDLEDSQDGAHRVSLGSGRDRIQDESRGEEEEARDPMVASRPPNSLRAWSRGP